jgi:hypothetical protein
MQNQAVYMTTCMAPSRAKAILSLPRAIAAESSARSACSSRYAARRSLHSSRASRQEKSDSKDSESPSRPSTSIPLGPPGPSGSVTPNEGTTPRITESTAGPSSVRNPNNLPAWIPPKWHPHLQPDAQWRKELLDRRRRLLEQAGEQLTVLGLKLNEVTGYREVERLKDLVEQKGKCIKLYLYQVFVSARTLADSQKRNLNGFAMMRRSPRTNTNVPSLPELPPNPT